MIKRHLEIETKYKADDISLRDFKKFCASREPLSTMTVSGFDHFYSNKDEPDSFCRHRTGPDKNEFTYKQKTSDVNNTVRKEVNVQMDDRETTYTAAALAESFGYTYDTTIFKTCFIYNFSDHTLVYYICYDTNMKELGRFFEIEAKEDFPWTSEQAAWDAILALERLFKPLGVSPQNRIKRSLYEMFRS